MTHVLDALAVLADTGAAKAEIAAVEALQRCLGAAVDGEVSPALLRRAHVAATVVHAEAQVEAARAAEEAAALYEQIAGDRERDVEASRARHPSRPTCLTEEEVGASWLAVGRSALEAAGHWRRAATARASLGDAAAQDAASSGGTAANPGEPREGSGQPATREAAADRDDWRGDPLALQLRAARARARAREAGRAAGPWFRSAAAGHLAAGDRLQGSRALEGALKAAALVAEATALLETWP